MKRMNDEMSEGTNEEINEINSLRTHMTFLTALHLFTNLTFKSCYL